MKSAPRVGNLPLKVTLATDARSRGGVWRHIVDLAVGLGELGHAVTIECDADATELRTAADSDGLSLTPHGTGPTSDIWHIHLADTYQKDALRLLWNSRRRHRRIVITEHLPRSWASDKALTIRPPRPGATLAKTVFKKLEYSQTDLVVAVSEGSQKFIMARYGLSEARVRAVMNGVDILRFPAVSRSVIHEGREGLRLAAVGSLIAQKGFDDLVAAAELAHGDWSVEVWGEGPHKAKLAAQAARAGSNPGRVAFRGWSDDLPQELEKVDALVVPSRWESAPYCVLEAMASGIPVIGTRVDGITEMIQEGSTGFLVAPNDPVSLARLLDSIADGRVSLTGLGAAARHLVEKQFTLDQMILNTESVYRDALFRRARGRWSKRLDAPPGAVTANSEIRRDRFLLVSPAEGGVGHVARCLSLQWLADGRPVHHVAIRDNGSIEPTPMAAIPSKGFGLPLAFKVAATTWAARADLRQQDAMHIELGRTAQSTFWFGLFLTFVNRHATVSVGLHDMPLVVTHPSAGLFLRRPGRWDGLVFKLFCPVLDRLVIAALRSRVDTTVVLSLSSARDAQLGGWPDVRITSHGAAAPTFGRPLPSEAAYVLLAGFLGPGKGLDVLAKAWSQIDSEIPLRIAGGYPPQHSEWIDAAKLQFGASSANVTWLGALNDEDFARAISEAAIVVLPYETSNPASGVLIRALVDGRAVVATKVRATEGEVLDGHNGLLAEAGDMESLARQLKRVIDSPDLRDALGKNATAHATARHSWSVHAGAIGDSHKTSPLWTS